MARFMKRIFVYVSFSIAITLVSGIVFFFISPNIINQYELVLGILLLVSLILISVLIIGFIKGSLKVFKIENRLQIFLILLIIVTCFFSTTIMLAFNNTINEMTVFLSHKDSITAFDKIKLLNAIGQNLRNDYRAKQYSEEMESQAYGHINFSYKSGDEDLVNELINNARHLDKALNSFIPTHNIQPVTVILYNEENNYRKATGTPENSPCLGLFTRIQSI